MINDAFVFDTYAILEIISGNPNYKNYLNSRIIINNFVFAELCYKLFREKALKTEEYIKEYSRFIQPLTSDTIREAMLFRINNKSKNLSMTDCISYIMSLKSDVKFLTGDKEFENLINVEFVK